MITNQGLHRRCPDVNKTGEGVPPGQHIFKRPLTLPNWHEGRVHVGTHRYCHVTQMHDSFPSGWRLHQEEGELGR